MNGVMGAVETAASFIPIAGPFISAALKIADATGLTDSISKHIGSGGEAVAKAVVDAAAAAAGIPASSDPAAIAAASIGLPADKRAELQVQLAQIAASREAQQLAADQAARQAQLDQIKAQLADVAGARSQTVALAQAGSGVVWAPVIVSAIVLLTFGAVMWVAMYRPLPSGSETIVNMLLGTLAAMASAVVSYWVGSSAGSAAKNGIIANHIAGQGSAQGATGQGGAAKTGPFGQ